MLNILFKGEPFVLFAESLDESGAIATMDDYKAGDVSYAHYYPDRGSSVMRYGDQIGTRDDIKVLGSEEKPEMGIGDYLVALRNMLGWMGR